MNIRSEPRAVPLNALWVNVPSGEYLFALPSQRVIWSEFNALGGDGAAKIIGVIDSDRSGDAVGVVFAILGDDVAAAFGLAIGRSWAHPEKDLDTVPGPDLRAYGLAVWDELEAAGIPYSDIVSVGCALLKTIVDASRVNIEAVRRADFFGPQRGKIAAPISPSGGSTSATHGHGTGSPLNSGSSSGPSPSPTAS